MDAPPAPARFRLRRRHRDLQGRRDRAGIRAGSLSRNRPSSHSIIAATEVRAWSSNRCGRSYPSPSRSARRSRWPKLSKNASRPRGRRVRRRRAHARVRSRRDHCATRASDRTRGPILGAASGSGKRQKSDVTESAVRPLAGAPTPTSCWWKPFHRVISEARDCRSYAMGGVVAAHAPRPNPARVHSDTAARSHRP